MTTTSKKAQQQDPVQDLNWSEMSASEHFVQFYETDEFLLNSLSEFIGMGLAQGDACIVIATKMHREGLEERLKANGQDLAAARMAGEYISLDVLEALSKFMVDGLPQAECFAEVFGSLIAQAAQGQRHVRIFGEMVALLWTEGNQTAALRLEELWNALRTVHPFTLFCAYSMPGFAGDVYAAQFIDICKQHSRAIPAESYSALIEPDERMRAITLLQQKASSLQAEIEERKAAEERLRISENRYRRLFEASKDGILMVDPSSGTILDANPAITDLLSYTGDSLLGQELWQVGLFPNREDNLAALQQLQERHFFRYETVPLHTKDGHHRYVEFMCTLYQADEQDVIQCSIRDITDRKLLEQRKDEFINMASHELKTPITSLKGFLALLHQRLTPHKDEKALHYLSRIDTQVNKLIKLISDLLDISKMQTGQLAYQEERFDVNALVQEIVENVQGTTSTHRLLLESQTQAEVFGDRDRIGQVLINLLNNAIKYSPRANTVLVRVAKDSRQVIISVQDFGIGIAKEHQHKIFERFYRVTDPAEKTYPGLGMGLYISCEIVKRHGGQLWVESKKDEGSTFHCVLPLCY